MRILNTIILIICSQLVSANLTDDISVELLELEYKFWKEPDSSYKDTILLEKAYLQKLAHQYNDALQTLDRIHFTTENISYEKALNYFLTGEYYLSLSTIEGNNLYNRNSIEVKKLWLYNLTELEYFDSCRAVLQNIHIDSERIYNLQTNINRKDPNKAERLSTIFPGLGQIYSGNTTKGLTNITLIGGFGTVAFFAFCSGLITSGFTWGVYPVFRFYTGGRKNSYYLTKQRNSDLIEDLKKQYRAAIKDL